MTKKQGSEKDRHLQTSTHPFPTPCKKVHLLEVKLFLECSSKALEASVPLMVSVGLGKPVV
jgi:hypothetical protein